MFKADGERRDFPLNKPVIVIGRKHTCDLRIPLGIVSREHCQVEVTEDELVVRDLGSSNGTYHNSERVQEAKLGAGDTLVIGPVHFTVVVDGQPADIAEPVKTVLPEGAAEVEAAAADEEPVSKAASGSQFGVEIPAEDIAAEVLDEPIEDEVHPTVEIEEVEDDDPIAALEALAAMDSGPSDDPEDALSMLHTEDEDDTIPNFFEDEKD